MALKRMREIYLTEIEVELMSILVKHKILKDSDCANILSQLANKLEVGHDKSNEKSSNS